jgi:hypothetical protein
VFTDGGTMGAATPIEVKDGKADAVGEKLTSYMRSEMRATAEAKDRDGEMAAAMVDADIEIENLTPKGKLLTLTTEMAERTGVANATVETLDELIGAMGMRGQPVIRTAPNWAERTAGFLTSPVVAGLLMLIGFLALMTEGGGNRLLGPVLCRPHGGRARGVGGDFARRDRTRRLGCGDLRDAWVWLDWGSRRGDAGGRPGAGHARWSARGAVGHGRRHRSPGQGAARALFRGPSVHPRDVRARAHGASTAGRAR